MNNGEFGALLILCIIIILISLLAKKRDPDEIANTWKSRTVIFTVLAFVIPFWIVTIPLFFYLAYRSYKQGKLATAFTVNPAPKLDSAFSGEAPQEVTSKVFSRTSEIAELHRLFQQGALTQDEFDQEKGRLLAK